MEPAELLHIEDDAMVAQLVRAWLLLNPKVSYLGHVATARDGLAWCREHCPKIILLDINLIDGSGLDFASLLAHWTCTISIILFTSRIDEAFLYRVKEGFYSGVVLKSGRAKDELFAAIDACLTGSAYYSPRFLDASTAFRKANDAFNKTLSKAQIALLPFLGYGRSDDEIARCTQLSPATVQTHRRDIMRKLDLHRTPELMNWIREKGFLL